MWRAGRRGGSYYHGARHRTVLPPTVDCLKGAHIGSLKKDKDEQVTNTEQGVATMLLQLISIVRLEEYAMRFSGRRPSDMRYSTRTHT